MEFKGTISKIYSQKGDWSCIRFVSDKDGKSYTAKGNITGAIYEGTPIMLEGEFKVHETYGKQIEVESSKILESPTMTFLYRCVTGVGKDAAKRIVNKYGEDCIKKIIKNPHILCEIKGIKEKRMHMIYESLTENEDISLYVEIFYYFNNDITQNQASKIIDFLKEKRKKFKVIEENPYMLITNIDGFGFKKVDKLARSAGIGEYSVERIGAAIIYALKVVANKSGHCYLGLTSLTKEVANLIIEDTFGITQKDLNYLQSLLIDPSEETDEYLEANKTNKSISDYIKKFDKILEEFSDAVANDISEGVLVLDDTRIYSKEMYDSETTVAYRIASMINKNPIKKISKEYIDETIKEIEEEEGQTYSDEQKNAVKTSLTNRISVITGGPGRGKTTILKIILDCWDDDENVILLAPTGRAAKRMSMATGMEAQTIQRYRNRIFLDEHTRHTDLRPKNKLIIVDEVSMLGISLAELTLWLAENNQLILVGDVDQLPSIEAGSFLKDLIGNIHVPKSILTHGFRNDGSIALTGQVINKRKGPKDYTYDEHTEFITTEKVAIPDEVLEKYDELIKTYDPMDICILSPITVRGVGSVGNLNKLIREKYNPETNPEYRNSSGFRIGDRVMQTKNNYKKKVKDHEAGELTKGIFNGDTGAVSEIDMEANTLTVFFDDNRSAKYSFTDAADELILSYALSIHKSQGSEYGAVLVIVSPEYSFFFNKSMFYTAVTRAKNYLGIIGDKKAAATASRKIDELKRNTYLSERISEEIKKFY